MVQQDRIIAQQYDKPCIQCLSRHFFSFCKEWRLQHTLTKSSIWQVQQNVYKRACGMWHHHGFIFKDVMLVNMILFCWSDNFLFFFLATTAMKKKFSQPGKQIRRVALWDQRKTNKADWTRKKRDKKTFSHAHTHSTSWSEWKWSCLLQLLCHMISSKRQYLRLLHTLCPGLCLSFFDYFFLRCIIIFRVEVNK